MSLCLSGVVEIHYLVLVSQRTGKRMLQVHGKFFEKRSTYKFSHNPA